MATQALGQARWVRPFDGAARQMRGGQEESWVQEAAAQAWKAGALVYLDTNGQLAALSGTPVTTAIAGQSPDDATGVTGGNTHVFPISTEDRFVMNTYHGTVGSAKSNQNLLGKRYPITIVSGNAYVDLEHTGEDAGTSNARVQVVGFWPEDAIGDTYGRVVVGFLGYSLASDGNPNTPILQLAQ